MLCGNDDSASMDTLISADDIEPLDADERVDAAYGPYWIGRADESRAELVLLFDARWIASDDPDAAIREYLLSAFGQLDAQFTHWGQMPSEGQAPDLFDTLGEHVHWVRPFDYLQQCRLHAVGIDVAQGDAGLSVTRLMHYPPYVGCGDVSWPNTLRTMVQEFVPTIWQLSWEHEDEPNHWAHHIRS